LSIKGRAARKGERRKHPQPPYFPPECFLNIKEEQGGKGRRKKKEKINADLLSSRLARKRKKETGSQH